MIYKLLNNKLFKSSLIYTACDAVNKAVPFLILPLLSYYLTPGDYGVVSNFNTLLAIFTICIALGIEGVIGVNFYKITKEELGKYIFNGLILIFGAALIVCLVSFGLKDLIYTSFKIPFTYTLWAIVLSLAATFTTINLALWRLEEQSLKFGIYQILQTIVNIGVSLILVVNYKMGWVGRIDGILIATLVFGLYSLFLLYKRGYLKVKINKSIKWAILSFGLPLIPHSLSMWLRSGIDRLYITNFYGEAATGLYATGFQFGILISFLTLAFNNAFVPFLYKSLSESDVLKLSKNKLKLKKITYLGFLSLIGLAVFFYLFSIVILKYFFNQDYAGASIFIFWAIVSQVFQGFYLFFVNYIFFVKKTKSLAVITFSCSLIQVIISYFLIKKMGPIGGAYSTAIVSAINFIMVAIYSNKVYKMNWLKIHQ